MFITEDDMPKKKGNQGFKKEDARKGYWRECMDGTEYERKSVIRRNFRRQFQNEY